MVGIRSLRPVGRPYCATVGPCCRSMFTSCLRSIFGVLILVAPVLHCTQHQVIRTCSFASPRPPAVGRTRIWESLRFSSLATLRCTASYFQYLSVLAFVLDLLLDLFNADVDDDDDDDDDDDARQQRQQQRSYRR